MRPTFLLLAAPLLVAAGAVPAGRLLLDDRNLDPALLLPPPPGDGSPAMRAEASQLRTIEATRTAAELDHARADDALKNVTIFAAAMGPAFDMRRLPETRALFDTVRAEEKSAADRAKMYFRRNRPWIADPAIRSCSREDEPQSSYPSGHTTMGFAMAGVLVRLVPARATAIMTRAADYARSRLVCEMHYPSDVAAGETWGTIIAERLMQQPAFRAQFDRSAAELQAAGLR